MGKSANTTIVVQENPKIDTVTLSAPETSLKQTVETALPIAITDTYGQEINFWDVTVGGANNSAGGVTELTLNDSSTKLTVTNAKLFLYKDYVNKVQTIKVKPEEGAKTVTFQVVTANNKVSTLTLSVLDKPVMMAIKGTDGDFAPMLANTNSSDVKTQIKNNVVFLDQYGDEYFDWSGRYPSFGSATTAGDRYYTVTAKTAAADRVTTGDGIGDIKAVGKVGDDLNVGADVFEVKLYEKASGEDKLLDTYEVAVTVVDGTKITEFAVDNLNKFYVGNTGAADGHNQQVKIYGLVNGNKVVVPQSMIKHVTCTALGTKLNASGAFDADAGTAIETKGEDKTAKITVLVDNGANTFTIDKEITYSSAAPAAASLKSYMDGDWNEVKDTVQVSHDDINRNLLETGKLFFQAKDQYNVVITSGFTFVLTSNNTNATISGSTISNVTDADIGKSFVINAFNNGLSATLKVIIE
jgi:hypothetical protein